MHTSGSLNLKNQMALTIGHFHFRHIESVQYLSQMVIISSSFIFQIFFPVTEIPQNKVYFNMNRSKLCRIGTHTYKPNRKIKLPKEYSNFFWFS